MFLDGLRAAQADTEAVDIGTQNAPGAAALRAACQRLEGGGMVLVAFEDASPPKAVDIFKSCGGYGYSPDLPKRKKALSPLNQMG